MNNTMNNTPDKTIPWLSRHDLSPEQLGDLAARLGYAPDVVKMPLVWAASDDPVADDRANSLIWESLDKYPIVLGVFPPVALESRGALHPTCLSPVSRQTASERADGTRQIAFIHLRWAEV